MTPQRTRAILYFAVALIACTHASAARAAPRAWPTAARRVVLISFDGLRPDAIEAARAPTLQRLVAGGATTLVCENELPPATLPNHASMLTGKPVYEHGVLMNWDLPGYIAVPTLFEFAKQAGLKSAFFASKSKFTFLCRPASVAVRVIDTHVDTMTDRALETLRDLRPDLTFIHFNEPDGAGHRIGWMTPEYLAAVRRMDALLARIMLELKQDGLLAETCVLITADHGGQGKNHAFNTPAERHVPMILFGAGVQPGRIIRKPMHVRDAAPITAFLLGIPMSAEWQERIPRDVLILQSPKQPSDDRRWTTASLDDWKIPLGLFVVGSLLIGLSHRRR